MSIPMKADDPAYWMLSSTSIKRRKPEVFRSGCYICEDPEFAQMGLPLCYKCSECEGHVPADDTICSDCGADAYEIYMENNAD